jgi:type VI protein secretion system component VasF
MKPPQDLPPWHPKRQKSYRVSRVLMWAQIALALALAAVIWFGMHHAMQ